MKAIIPVAGAGTRLRPLTYTQPKALIPIAGKTILSFIVDRLQEGGVREFVFVLGYLGEKIKDYVQTVYPHLTCHFVYQNERLGTAHAVKLAHDIIGEDELMVVMGDTLCEYNIRKFISSPHSMLGVQKVDNPSKFGVAEIGEDNKVTRVIEKPMIPKSNYALVGIYKIRETKILYECILELIRDQKNDGRDYQLTDALECMINKGVDFRAMTVDNWFDCGQKDSLLASNSILLKKSGGNVHPINHGYEDTIIVPPVSIAPGCKIKNSVIGPHVAIGSNTVINKSILRDSIIGSYANLYEVVLDNSLIGSDAVVKGLSRSLSIGDNTEIDFG